MSQLFTLRRKLVALPVTIVLIAVIGLTLLPGCSGGGGGGGSILQFVGAVADGLGLLPQSNVFLNNRITVTLSTGIDPDSVSTQTFRVLEGPDFVEVAPGSIGVSGDKITFVPQLPSSFDLSDAGFKPNTTYRIVLRGLPDLNTIRSSRGKPLLNTTSIEFTTRQNEPLFTDLVPGNPRVIGVMIDLNGNGEFDGDGDPATPSDEEFFVSDTNFNSPIPFVTGVPVGSVSLPAPNAPLKVGFLFNEPLNPSSVFKDAEDLNDDGTPDGDGVFDSFSTLDQDNTYICDDPFPGDQCSRPMLFSLDLEQVFVAERGVFKVLVTSEYAYALRAFSRHQINAFSDIADFVGNTLTEDFRGVFETGDAPVVDDFFFEDFTTKVNRDVATTGHWNPDKRRYLAAGVGFGGDGSDGPGIGPDDGELLIDTSQGTGIYNFDTFTLPQAASFNINIIGDKPAIIRVLGSFDFNASTVTVNLNGEDGLEGAQDSVAPRPGGTAGPGGTPGGGSSFNGSATVKGEDAMSPEGTTGGGRGGLSGAAPGGGGGGGHRVAGTDGRDGSGTNPGMGGDGGESYGDPIVSVLRGGAGGGAGGNNNAMNDGSPGSSGGSGGGGGGAVLFEAFENFNLRGPSAINADGGRGGRGVTPSNDDGSAGGGAGAGGVVVVRSRRWLAQTGQVSAVGGSGGLPGRDAGRGGNGAAGFIKTESLAGNQSCNCTPNEEQGLIPSDVLGRSAGRSAFLLTNASDSQVVEYHFDGNMPSDPTLPGRVRTDAADILVLDEFGNPALSDDDIPSNASIQILFRGAFEDPKNPNNPDPTSIGPWVADIADVNGYPMIQWETRFNIGTAIGNDPADDPPMPGVDDIRVGFSVR